MDARVRPEIGTRRFAIVFLGVVALPLLSTAAACDTKSKSATPVASVEAPPPPKPGAPLGASCSANEDCAKGTGCADDKTCQSFKTIECRGRELTCKAEGRCTGSDKGGCVAASSAECKKARVCEEEGRCNAQDGKCVATASDCKSFCPLDGRCSVVDGKCAAASHADCRQSETCKQQKRCIAKRGVCVKT